MHLEERTARLTILIDPRKKAVFERLCAEEDLTSSQVVRRMIRSYIEEHLKRPWNPAQEMQPDRLAPAGAVPATAARRATGAVTRVAVARGASGRGGGRRKRRGAPDPRKS